MDYIDEFVDERQKLCCPQCGAWIGEVGSNRDHVPSKVLLRRPYPNNLPVVASCTTCNISFSADEEYLSFVFSQDVAHAGQERPVPDRCQRLGPLSVMAGF